MFAVFSSRIRNKQLNDRQSAAQLEVLQKDKMEASAKYKREYVCIDVLRLLNHLFLLVIK
jgi:hypothetical protein